MKRHMSYSIRGIERATTKDGPDKLIRQTVNGRSELLPADPHQTAKILRERRAKTPALAAKARMVAAARKRGLGG